VSDDKSSSDDDFAIDLQGVTRRFGRQRAVNDVTLRIPRGATCGFVGLNGAGKSTTIRVAVGLMRPTAGTLRVAGVDPVRDHVELCRRVGYVPDRPTVYGWMRVGEAIAFVRRFHGPAWDAARCDDLVRRLRLPLDARVSKLSKGQAAKLQLLLAVCHGPRVLILDEPTSGFDPVVREEFLQSVLRVAGDSGQTVLFSSHGLADVQRIADRVAILHEGQLVAHESIDALVGRTKRVRVVSDDFVPTPPGVGVLRRTRDGRAQTLTIDRFTPDVLPALGASAEVFDVTLDDWFKDFVRGRDEAADARGANDNEEATCSSR
jgi:ABC-2 type transport system ATP-binding protein